MDKVLGQELPSTENLAKLHFLDQVIKETLRLYPPIHAGNRLVSREVQIKGCQIPKGTRTIFSIYLTHRDERNWPDAEQFYPERFDPQASRSHPPFTYLPFGGGPRNCIGAIFARIETKVVLARILQTFDLKLVSKRVFKHMGATLEPRPGVLVHVSRRN